MALYISFVGYQTLLRLPPIKDSRNSTIKIKNRTFAIDAAPAAMPKKPKIPAMIAMIKKITVQRNICVNFWLLIMIMMFKKPCHMGPIVPGCKYECAANTPQRYTGLTGGWHNIFTCTT